MTATVEQTQADLARIIELAREGEEVVITRGGEPIAKLTGLDSVRPPGYFDDCYDAAQQKSFVTGLTSLEEEMKKKTGSSGEYHSGCSLCGTIK